MLALIGSPSAGPIALRVAAERDDDLMLDFSQPTGTSRPGSGDPRQLLGEDPARAGAVEAAQPTHTDTQFHCPALPCKIGDPA